MENELNNSVNSSTKSSFESESDDSELHYRFPMWAICIMSTAYMLVFIFGVIGNCCVLLIIARFPRLRTITNLFVCNLAVADMLVLVFCLLPNLISNIYVEWILGFYVCKTVPYIQGVAVCSSVYSLVAISVERLITIRRPSASPTSKNKAYFLMITVWIWSSVVALPWALFFQTGTFDPDNPKLIFCLDIWPEPVENWSGYYFLFGNFLICYIFPLSIILFSYLLICQSMIQRRRRRQTQQANNVTSGVLKSIIVIVVIFFLTWLPLYAVNLYMKFFVEDPNKMSEVESSVMQVLYPVGQLLCHVGSAVNPYVYGFRKKEFINGFWSLLRAGRRSESAFMTKWNNRRSGARFTQTTV